MPADWGIDKRNAEILEALKKGLPAADVPEARDLQHPKTKAGGLAPIILVRFRNWEARKAATPIINGISGRGARVVFGSSTNKLNRMLIGAAANVTKALWGASPPAKAEQRSRIQILFREVKVKVDGEVVLERTGPEEFRWVKFAPGDRYKATSK